MKKYFFFLFVNLAIFCTLIVVMEISGQIIYYLIHGRFIFQAPVYSNDDYNKTFELHPFLAGRPKKNITVKYGYDEKEIKTTSNNTRWTGAPEDDSKLIRVAVLGGSTTFATGVTDSDSWPALLQTKLGNKFSVINYGVPGYSTAEAIIQLALVVPEAKPQFVILYEGWNDIHNYHEMDLGPDYYSHGIRQYDNLEIPISIEKTVFEKLYELSAIIRLAVKFKSKLYHPSKNQVFQTFDTPDPFVDKIYARNLKTLKLLSEELATYTLFVPQVLNYSEYLEGKGPDGCKNWSRYIKNNAMPRLMNRFNSLMQSACSKNDSKSLFVKSVLMESWEPEDFVDCGHFSRKGAEKFADIISQVILSKAKEENLYNYVQ